MLTLLGQPMRFCDGISRRAALKVGALSFGAASLSLSDIFRAEAAEKQVKGSSQGLGHKAIINILLAGGAPHQDTFDLKMDAPSEIRGEFKPIDTNVPGLQICEVFEKLSKIMDRFSVIRSVVGATGRHDLVQNTTGFTHQSLAAMGGRPGIGAALSKLLGPVDPSVPPFVGLTEPTRHLPWSDPGQAGFLGSSFAAFRPNGPDIANMKLNAMNSAHLKDRKTLLKNFDSLRKQVDANQSLGSADAHTQRALDVLLSSKLLDAIDLSKEDPKVVERYGDGKPYQFQYDGAPTANDQFLMARRLVQAGARAVSLSFGRWDSHGKNFDMVRDHGSKLDQALTALMWDLERLDMLDDVTVVVWGEFGRTPRINDKAGRDHWPQVSSALIGGGGIRTSQVVGATNRLGEYAKERPVKFGEIFATLYHSLGLNPATTTIDDPTGRPQHLTDGDVIRELV